MIRENFPSEPRGEKSFVPFARSTDVANSDELEGNIRAAQASLLKKDLKDLPIERIEKKD